MTAPAGDFNLRALYDALDVERRSRDLTWGALTAQVNRRRTRLRPIALSTITGLRDKAAADGDGVLQMLLWLERTPESFVSGIDEPEAPQFRLPALSTGEILRWDARALFSALEAQRGARDLTWAAVAKAVGGYTPGMLTNLAAGPRIGFPRVMRLVRWLGRPAVAFTRIAQW